MIVASTNSLPELSRIVYGAQLPGLPQSAVSLLELSRDRENGPSEFARAIEGDPGLTSQVLRFVNSSYFGFSREVSSVKLGITLVGIRTIKNFALWSAIFSLMPDPRHGSFDLKKLWLDSLRRGLFSRSLGTVVGVPDVEMCFVAAMLQDMAIPVLLKELAEPYATLLDCRQDGHVQLSQLEQQHFGWDHARAGRIIAEKWNLPDHLALLIEQHTNLDGQLRRQPAEQDSLVVALSALLPPATDTQWTDFARFADAYRQICPTGGPALVDLLAEIDATFSCFAPILELSSEHKPLADIYRESAQIIS